MDQSFREPVTRAGLEQTIITPYVMRHTAITRLIQSGVNRPMIQRISGDKTLAIILRCAHVYGEHICWTTKVIGHQIAELIEKQNAITDTPRLHRHRRGTANSSSQKYKIRRNVNKLRLEAGTGIEPM